MPLPGARERELIGKNVFAIIGEPGEPSSNLKPVVAHTIARKSRWRGVSRLTTKEGRERWQEWVNQPQFNPSGELEEVLSVGRDTTRRVLLEKALQKRLVFQRVVTQISSSFVSLHPGDVEKVVNATLKAVGEFMNADRCHVFFVDLASKSMRNAYEWCAEGIKPQIDVRQALKMSGVPRFSEVISRREVYYVPNVAELGEEAAKEKAAFSALEVQSVLAVPMEAGGELIGFLGLEAVRDLMSWSGEDIQSLNMVANIIAVGLERCRDEGTLLRQQKRLELVNEITQAALYAPNLDWLLNRAAGLLKDLVEASAAVVAIGEDPRQPVLAAGIQGNFAEELRKMAAEPGVYLDLAPVEIHLKNEGNHLLSFINGAADGNNAPADEPQERKAELLTCLQDEEAPAFQSQFAFQLVAANLKLGTARIFFEDPRELPEADLELCEQAAAANCPGGAESKGAGRRPHPPGRNGDPAPGRQPDCGDP